MVKNLTFFALQLIFLLLKFMKYKLFSPTSSKRDKFLCTFEVNFLTQGRKEFSKERTNDRRLKLAVNKGSSPRDFVASFFTLFRRLKSAVNKVSSLQDCAASLFTLFRRLKSAVNKGSSLQDCAASLFTLLFDKACLITPPTP